MYVSYTMCAGASMQARVHTHMRIICMTPTLVFFNNPWIEIETKRHAVSEVLTYQLHLEKECPLVYC